MAIERAPEPVVRKEVRNGKVEEVIESAAPEQLAGFMDPMLASMYEDTLVLGPKAKNLFPGAVTGQLTFDHPEFGPWRYRVIRPEAHRESRPWFYGMSGRITPKHGDGESPAPIVSPVQSDGVELEEDAEEPPCMGDAPR
jgi:hypothetical protein